MEENKKDRSAGHAEMTLRDYFAAQAIDYYANRRDTRTFQHVARKCYKLADAMLEERKK